MSAVRWGQAIDNAALAVEIEGFCTLLALLAAEQDALRTADADALARIVPQKLTQVHALRSMSVARTALLRSAGLAATAAGMRTLLARSPEPERAGEQWQTLTRLAVEAQRVNALNIRLAHTQERHVDQAMATLSHAAGRDVTYGADGRSQHHAPSRSLAAI